MPYKTLTSGQSAIQSMPFVENFIDIGSGNISGMTLIMCKADGAITITFDGGGIKVTTMTEGQVRKLPHGCTVTITSGTFDFA